MNSPIELAADAVAWYPAAAQHGAFAKEPPFAIAFRLIQGKGWPEVQLHLSVGGHAAFAVTTTEPRLKQALQSILADLS